MGSLRNPCGILVESLRDPCRNFQKFATIIYNNLQGRAWAGRAWDPGAGPGSPPGLGLGSGPCKVLYFQPWPQLVLKALAPASIKSIGNVLWQQGNVLWQLGNVLWQLGNILWQLGNVLWQLGNVLWQLGSVLWQLGTWAPSRAPNLGTYPAT